MSNAPIELRAAINIVSQKYDKRLGTGVGVECQDFLRSIKKRAFPVPPGMRATGNGGDGYAALCPWIGVTNPDITADSKDGLYLAYLFSIPLRTVTLTLQQGVEGLRARLGRTGPELRAQLAQRAEMVRGRLPTDTLEGWRDRLELGESYWRPRAYEAGSIAARRYDLDEPPSENTLRRDLWAACEILNLVAQSERVMWREPMDEELRVHFTASTRHRSRLTAGGFSAKTDQNYIAKLSGGERTRSPRHEGVLNAFVDSLDPEFKAHNRGVHPRDLVLTRGAEEWTAEVKVIRDRTGVRAGREAVSQLLEYRHFYASENSKLLAVFDQPIGDYVSYMETLDIASVWPTIDGWTGSPKAVEWGVVGVARSAVDNVGASPHTG